ncbi:MAG: outer membrane protein assembly factor BamE [Colwellia sp.]
MYFRVAIVITALTLSACSSWVFRYDIPQGNYLDKNSISKLQVDMTKEQVKFILGSPVVVDSFDNDVWSYVYQFKSGRNKRFDQKRELIITFVDDKVTSATGDYKLSENFNTPFNTLVVTDSIETTTETEGEVTENSTAEDNTAKSITVEDSASESVPAE